MRCSDASTDWRRGRGRSSRCKSSRPTSPNRSVPARLAEVDQRRVDERWAPRCGTNSPLDALAGHLGGGEWLLILDNLEQVVGVARDLVELLARCPRLAILATSRTVLRL